MEFKRIPRILHGRASQLYAPLYCIEPIVEMHSSCWSLMLPTGLNNESPTGFEGSPTRNAKGDISLRLPVTERRVDFQCPGCLGVPGPSREQ
jgi:hypothetical protein